MSIPGTGPVGPSQLQDHQLGHAMQGGDCRRTVRPLPFFATLVLTNVAVGNCAASKKFGPFRSPSRWATPVSTVVTSTVTFTEDFVMSLRLVQRCLLYCPNGTHSIGSEVEDGEVDPAVCFIRYPGGCLRDGQWSGLTPELEVTTVCSFKNSFQHEVRIRGCLQESQSRQRESQRRISQTGIPALACCNNQFQ